MTEIPPLPEQIRATLPPAVQAYIGAQEAVIVARQTLIATLQERVSASEARTRQTSRNSSRPPSSDPPAAPPRPPRPASPRKRGAQPDHRRHERRLLPVEEVDDEAPTNNDAERALRPAVLWHKGCFGTQSEGGDQFVSRILTVVATCRKGAMS